jgi:hypothetical protein
MTSARVTSQSVFGPQYSMACCRFFGASFRYVSTIAGWRASSNKKELVIHEIEHVVYRMALEERPLKLQGRCAVIENGAMRQHQTNPPAFRDVMRGFPNERRRNLLVGDRIRMIGVCAPFSCERIRQRNAAPRWISDDQIGINGVFCVLGEEIAAPNVTFNPFDWK